MSEFLLKENRDKLQRMSNMIRYNNEVHVHDENVAEHSFYVAVYAMELCDVLHIKPELRNLIVEKALIHDIHEIELSDIPHNVKKASKELEDYCMAFEDKFNRRYFKNLIESIDDCKLCTYVDAIVELADVLSVKQYAQQEVMFGNVKKFSPILENANYRIDKLIEVISRYTIHWSDIKFLI